MSEPSIRAVLCPQCKLNKMMLSALVNESELLLNCQSCGYPLVMPLIFRTELQKDDSQKKSVLGVG